MSKFEFTIYNDGRKQFDTYTVTKTKKGWHLRYISINGDCDPNGNPFFKSNFKHDNINYPSGFSDYLEWLWEQLDAGNINDQQAQKMFQELGNWVTACEEAHPRWKGWNS